MSEINLRELDYEAIGKLSEEDFESGLRKTEKFKYEKPRNKGGYNMGLVETETLISQAISKSVKPCVAFSGGKDSVVVLDLVRKMDKNIPAIFCNTGVEWPETVSFCRGIPNLVELNGIKTFWECVDKYGWPTTKSSNKVRGNACCLWLKEKPSKKYYKENNFDLIFTGLTKYESRNRRIFLEFRGPLYYAKTQKLWKCHPIHDWTPDDVWNYIKTNNLDYNPIYDRGAKRCGCGPCTAYLSWKKALALENPKLLSIILKKQGQAQLKFDCSGNII